MEKILSPEKWFIQEYPQEQFAKLRSSPLWSKLMKEYARYCITFTLKVVAVQCAHNCKKQVGCGHGKNGSILSLSESELLKIE